jgi:hypothetical protein
MLAQMALGRCLVLNLKIELLVFRVAKPGGMPQIAASLVACNAKLSPTQTSTSSIKILKILNSTVYQTLN